MANGVNVKVDIDHKKIKSEMSKRNKRAVMILKSEIVKDTEPYVPMRDRALRNSALKSAMNSDDKITYATPYARFLWHGKVMIGIRSHSPFAKRNETKTVINQNLTYSHGGKEWFLKSKKKNLQRWMNVIKKLYKRG